MRWLVELSGEHPTLPRAEALAGFGALGARPERIEQDGALLTLDASAKAEILADRLALSHYVNEHIVAGTFEEILSAAEKIELAGSTFMVRAPAKGGKSARHSVERKVGLVMGGSGKVDLIKPDVVFRVHEGQRWHLSRVLCKIDRRDFEKRRTANRPFKKPVSLHPRLARALVNLTRVTPAETLLDPFCGTGGILLEASMVGANVVGSDIDAAMVAGSRRTFDHFNREGRFIRADVGEIPSLVRSVEAVATDPPYGRSSSTRKEPIESLYLRAFETFSKVLKYGGRAAVCLPDRRYARLAGSGLRLEEEHAVRVHGSLTRHFMVFSRRP